MAHFAFELPSSLPAPQREALLSGWLSGSFDSVPVPTVRDVKGQTIRVDRTENESAYFCTAWPLPKSPRVVSSATLRPNAGPYRPLVELARGSVNRVRQFVSVLGSAGFDFPTEFRNDLAEMTRNFGRLTLGTDTTASGAGVIEHACRLADDCASLLTNYRFNARSQAGPLTTQLGCRLSRPLSPNEQQLYLKSFNAVRIVPDWSAIEPKESQFKWNSLDTLVNWASDNKLAISFGPLIDLTDGRFPSWFGQWQGDFPSLVAFASDFVATMILRYKKQVRSWMVFAGFNHGDTLGLGEDDRLRFAARLLETVQELDPAAERSFSVAQPWGEYLTQEELTYAPFVFADTLLRVGYELHGLELEILGPSNSQRGAVQRDALDGIHQFELYDNLGLPMQTLLGYGSDSLVPTAMAVPSMKSVIWDTWSTADPCARSPQSALVSPTGDPLPALAHFTKLLDEWLTTSKSKS
jgi:hypothetical protein